MFDEINEMSPELLELDASATESSLPDKSKGKYEAVYKNFVAWQATQKTKSFSENVLLVYFNEQAKKYKSSTLWAFYSMLKSTLNIYHNVHIENYTKLLTFLKCKSVGHCPKKAKIFTPDEVNKFIKEAPDDSFLMTKVALIMGLVGACRIQDLYSLKFGDIQDYNGALIVNIPVSKTKNRPFTVSGEFYVICKKYMDIRPSRSKSSAFFLNYQNGKCGIQRVGINKLASMGKQIATYLKVKNPELYTGHSLRRSSATICVGGGGYIIPVKKAGRWVSTTSHETNTDDDNKSDDGNEIINETISSSSSSINKSNELTEHSAPAIDFVNCNNEDFESNDGLMEYFINENEPDQSKETNNSLQSIKSEPESPSSTPSPIVRAFHDPEGKSIQNQSGNDDDCDPFCRMVAAELRLIKNPSIRRRVKTKIFSILMEEQEADD
ncbi:uncharacterized protein LOC109606560 [Aethina tumida]|uniref:uncharacterized protein LOC109606560 n=1 Tax=Aethina tumida TaxID=116153 RepID=UPI0021495591|nr:uncharacterized protein LOC109606560 [Aethina tumida]